MSHLIPHLRRIAHRVSRREDGFTMIAAIVILLVTSLLVTVTLVSAGGDIALTHNSINQKKAYYAALAGISAYQYELNTNSSYWKTCPSIPKNKSEEPERTVQGTEHETTPEHYFVVTKPAEKENGTSYTEAECKSGKQQAIIETSGSADGTFRIESTGTVGTGSEKVTRKLVATFSHPGFLNYVYLTNYEILDPAAQNPEPTDCEHYYKYRSEHHISDCTTIEFAPEDKVNGPLHTNDAAAICSSYGSKPTFGREGHKDKIEINGGRYAACGSDEWNMLGEFTEKGPTLTPPETDTELLENAEESGLVYTGRTEIELKPTSPNTIQRTNNKGEKEPVEDVPGNGVIYVENEGSCGVKYSPFGTDTDYETDQKCGDVYVHGEYTEQLTIAAQNDVIINGNLKTKTEGGGQPTGEGALGLIATNFVRVYHPVTKTYTGSLSKASLESSNKAASENTKTQRIEAELKLTSRTEPSFETTSTKSSGSCSPSSKWESFGGKCYSKECSGSGYAYIGEGKCEKCSSGEYVSSEKKCASTSCSSGYTYAGEGECEKCKTSYEYIGSEKKCASVNCATGESYLTGEGSCAKCPSGDLYVASEKKCATTSCNSGYTYAGNWECGRCGSSSETLEANKKECVRCSSGDTYLKEVTCEYENNSSTCHAENENASEDPNKWGSLENPTIDAAILSTAHSFIVDNYACGKHLGELTVWGAIAQFWRGPVGTGSNSTGYTKNYNYDERLEYLQPPDFLSPTSSKLTLDRVTAAGS